MQGEVTAPRRAALEVLRSVRAGELLDRAMERAAAGVEPRDVGWLQELLYGTFRLRGRLDYLLSGWVRSGLDSLQPDVLDVLRLGLYQLLEMGSVPAYAAVSQSVELVRAAGAPRAAGLVNGVLQSARRDRDRLRFPDAATDPVAHLTHWGSHPRWLVERWMARWGTEEVRALVEANNRRPELYLRPVRLDRAAAAEALAQAGVPTETVELAPDSLRVPPPTPVQQALAAVPAVVQDPAAALVVRYAAVPAGATVVDLCAAPGGKAVGLAGEGRFVVAADLSVGRLRRVRENVERCGLREEVVPVVADGRAPPFRPVDAVLLDAPCTGTGTLRRHPDGRWRLTPAALDSLASLQRELLDAASELVRPGGLLIYATCSLEPEENEAQVDAFLARHPRFTLRPEPGAVAPELLDARGRLCVLPQRTGVDGSFAARLQRYD